MFPDSNHIFPDQLNSDLFQKKLNDSIVYLPVEKYDLLEPLKVKLITNLFSFGEMKEEVFEKYEDINELFPFLFKSRVHFNSKGYKKVAETIYNFDQK